MNVFYGEHLTCFSSTSWCCKGRASMLRMQLYSDESMWKNIAFTVGEVEEVFQLQTWT